MFKRAYRLLQNELSAIRLVQRSSSDSAVRSLLALRQTINRLPIEKQAAVYKSFLAHILHTDRNADPEIVLSWIYERFRTPRSVIEKMSSCPAITLDQSLLNQLMSCWENEMVIGQLENRTSRLTKLALNVAELGRRFWFGHAEPIFAPFPGLVSLLRRHIGARRARSEGDDEEAEEGVREVPFVSYERKLQSALDEFDIMRERSRTSPLWRLGELALILREDPDLYELYKMDKERFLRLYVYLQGIAPEVVENRGLLGSVMKRLMQQQAVDYAELLHLGRYSHDISEGPGLGSRR